MGFAPDRLPFLCHQLGEGVRTEVASGSLWSSRIEPATFRLARAVERPAAQARRRDGPSKQLQSGCVLTLDRISPRTVSQQLRPRRAESVFGCDRCRSFEREGLEERSRESSSCQQGWRTGGLGNTSDQSQARASKIGASRTWDAHMRTLMIIGTLTTEEEDERGQSNISPLSSTFFIVDRSVRPIDSTLSQIAPLASRTTVLRRSP